MNKAVYTIDNKQNPITEAEFLKLTSLLEAMKGIGVNFPTDEKNTAYIFYNEVNLSELHPKLSLNTTSVGTIKLETDLGDALTGKIIKELAQKLGMRTYFDNLECYLPKATYIHSCISFSDNKFLEAQKVMLALGFTPIFNIEPNDIYYAKYKDDSIHIINDNLLTYLTLIKEVKTYYDEFSYKVAKNIEEFVRKFDAELIPTNFYEYYKKSLKIINYSGLDLENPKRKVFIKPYILEFDENKLDFFKIAAEGSALLYMDKIREGENLDKALSRIIKDELRIANDYIGATVSNEIEFDLDKNNVLTPRIVAKVYLEKANLTKEQIEKKDRTWISFEQIKDSKR